MKKKSRKVEVFPGRSLGVPMVASQDAVRLDEGLFKVEVELDITPEGIRPVKVCVSSSESGDRPSAVRLTTLRTIKVAELAQWAVLRGLFPADDDGDWDPNPVLLERLIDSDELERVRNLGLCDESLSYAAYAYTLGGFLGFHPAQQVEWGLGLSRQSVSRWVALAREREWIRSPEHEPVKMRWDDFWDFREVNARRKKEQ